MDKFVQNSLFRRLQIERSQFLKYLFKEYDWISVGAVSSAVSQLVLSPTNLTSMVASGANSHKKNLAAERCHGSSLKGSILWVCIYSTSFKATLAQEAVSPVHVSNTNYGKYLTWWLLEVVKPLRFTRSWTKKKWKFWGIWCLRGLCKTVTCYGESRRTDACAGLCVRHSRVLEGLISHLWLTDYVQAGREG